MISVHLHGPGWFLGVDAILEAGAALIALLVAFASFKLYRLTEDKKYKYFTASFILLTLSFLARSITDALIEDIFIQLSDSIKPLVFFGGYLAHILFALTAYLILITLTYRITDKRIIALLFLILVPSMLLSGSYFLSFYGLSTLFLLFVAFAYYQNYRKVCSGSSCLVFVAFLLLAFAQPQFVLESTHRIWYVTAHATQSLGYLSLLIALIRILFK